MPVTLESRVRRMQVFHLPHAAYCRDGCACVEVTVVIVARHPRTGERAAKMISKKVPSSITILARERKTNLPLAVLSVPEVKAAIGRGSLRVIEQRPEPSPGAAVPTAAPASSAPAAIAPAATPSAPPAAPVVANPPEGRA